MENHARHRGGGTDTGSGTRTYQNGAGGEIIETGQTLTQNLTIEEAESAMGIIMGGHVRVGLEDNIFVKRRVLAKNVDLVEKVKRLAAEFEREIATPDEARQILGLKGLDAVNF